MSRIPALEYEQMSPEMQAAYDHQVARHGRMTNMKRTLAHVPEAFHALMQWYTLRDVVLPWLGERSVNLFSHAISAETDCLICSTFFRRILIDEGEDADDLKLDEREQIIVQFGRQLAVDPNRVSDELYEQLTKHFDQSQMVALTAFGAMMIATNAINNALKVDLDDYLVPFRKKVE